MSKRLFDISRLKSGTRSEDREPVRGRESKEEARLVKQAISELSAISLDEMTEALPSLECGVTNGTEKNTFTLDEIYGVESSQALASDVPGSDDELLDQALSEGVVFDLDAPIDDASTENEIDALKIVEQNYLEQQEEAETAKAAEEAAKQQAFNDAVAAAVAAALAAQQTPATTAEPTVEE